MAKLTLLALAALLGLSSAALGAEEQEQPSDATDWEATISRLQQEVYQRPGLAQPREQLAVAFNNYGVKLASEGRWDLAVSQLQESLRVDSANVQAKENLARIHLNRAHEAFQQHQPQDALAAIEQALQVDPSLAAALALRGEIEYGSQKLKEAKLSWEQSLKLDPNQEDIKKKLLQLSQELPVESGFERVSQASFDVRYQDGLQESIGFDVRDVLIEARRQVGTDFAYWPKHKIVVLVYSAESFRALRQETPEWVGGQFDGKIRVPLPNKQMSSDVVRQILFHEYTHALIQDLADGKCPVWLNEGLAEYEGRQQYSAPLAQLKKAHETEQLIPWAELSDHFSMALPADSVSLAYQQSYSITHYFVQRYGFWRMRRILKAVNEEAAWEKVFEEEFHLKLKTLEANWKRSLPEFFSQ